MSLAYDRIRAFMEGYFRAFGRYAQRPDGLERMREYLSSKFEFVPYMAGVQRISDRDEFLRLLAGHPSTREELEPELYTIDAAQGVAVVLIAARLVDTATEELLGAKRYHAVYWLEGDGGEPSRIRRIHFFEEIQPPGSPDFGEIFQRDAGIAGLFASPS